MYKALITGQRDQSKTSFNIWFAVYIYISRNYCFQKFPNRKKSIFNQKCDDLSFHVTAVQFSCHNCTVFMSQLYGFHVRTVRFSCQNCMVFMSQLYGFHVTTVWFPCHNYMVFMSQLYGFHVTTVWFPCHKIVKKLLWVSTNTCNQQCIFIFIICTCDLVILNTNNVINQIFIPVLLVLIKTVLHTICFWCVFSICWHVKNISLLFFLTLTVHCKTNFLVNLYKTINILILMSQLYHHPGC